MKATDLLIQQHKKAKALFKKLEHGRGDTAALLEELANDLAAHMLIEHELFYPAVIALDEHMVEESFEEHALGEIALKRLLTTDPAEEGFRAKVTAVKELIEHHADEEEQELFPKVEKAIDADQLKQLGKEMKARFAEAQAQGWEQIYPRGLTASKTLADASGQKLLRARARKRAA
jgi:iron-sulfur cluster repair protein YtfE (RIC family)